MAKASPKKKPSAKAAPKAAKASAKRPAPKKTAKPAPKKPVSSKKSAVAAAATKAPAAKTAAKRGSPPPTLKAIAPPKPSAAKSRVPEPMPVVATVKMDSGLNAKDIEQYREMLLTKRRQLIGDVTTLRDEALGKNRQDAAGDLSNMPLHPADVGSDNYEQEFALGLIENERQTLKEIDEALERIQKGTYGICAATGQPIGKARLNAKPWAKHSYEYVLAQERSRMRGRA